MPSTPATVTLRNTNPLGDVDVPILGRVIAAGEEFECPADIAGRAPSGEPGADDYDLGEGLLAQIGNYELVPPAAPAKKRTASED